jgi:hypothetical protein
MSDRHKKYEFVILGQSGLNLQYGPNHNIGDEILGNCERTSPIIQKVILGYPNTNLLWGSCIGGLLEMLLGHHDG